MIIMCVHKLRGLVLCLMEDRQVGLESQLGETIQSDSKLRSSRLLRLASVQGWMRHGRGVPCIVERL